jgi:hypothetical protein
MNLRRGPGIVAAIATAVLLTSSLPSQAARPTVGSAPTVVAAPAPADTVNTGAAADATAVSTTTPLIDAVSVMQIGDLTPGIRDLALEAASDAGAPAVVGRSFTSFLFQTLHQGVVIQSAQAPGWAFPMATTALPLSAVASIWGRDLSTVLAAGQVVMSQTSASLRGAQAGDLLYLVGFLGAIVPITIGRVVPDATIGGTEILMSTDTASAIGQNTEARVLVYGQFDHQALDAQLAARGLLGNPKIGVYHSWDPPSPDNTLSLAETKRVMGEFDFYWPLLATAEWTSINANWIAQYVSSVDVYAHGIVARCNVVIKADLAAALDEVNATYPGLFNIRTGIDVGNTNRYGGCSNNGEARFARNTTNISRHSWGQPIDMSTVANAQGGVPVMDCRIVRIFRSHNFAWGGNFLRPDGMHFEWVGTPRNTIQYPSPYCPNTPSGLPEGLATTPSFAAPVAATIHGLGTLFSGDGLAGE